MTLPLSKEQIEALQARAELSAWKGPNGLVVTAALDLEALQSLCQQALRAIELEAQVKGLEEERDKRDRNDIRTAELICSIQSERDALQSDKDRLTKALEDVCNPLGKLTRDAEAVGGRLSNAAYGIANSLGFAQRIAREALFPTQHKPIRGGGI